MWAVEDTWLPLGPYAFAHTYTQAALGVRDSLTCKVEPKEVFMSSTAHKQKNPLSGFLVRGPWRIRTSDRLLKRQLLYQAELTAHACMGECTI